MTKRIKTDEGNRRKALGAYYTPPAVARWMAREALIAYLAPQMQGVANQNLQSLEQALRRLLAQGVINEKKAKASNESQASRAGGAGCECKASRAGETISFSDVLQIKSLILGLRALDPAAGDGALLLALLEEMAGLLARLDELVAGSSGIRGQGSGARGQRFGIGDQKVAGACTQGKEGKRESASRLNEYVEHIAAHCLYGVDIEEGAVESCRGRLRERLTQTGIDAGACLIAITNHIAAGDALLGKWPLVAVPSSEFRVSNSKGRGEESGVGGQGSEVGGQERQEASAKATQLSLFDCASPTEIVNRQSSIVNRSVSCLLPPVSSSRSPASYDIILMNPPYVSFGLRESKAAAKAWREAILRRYPHSAEYKISLYAVFMDRALEFLRPGGAFCFLTPDSFLLGRYFSKLRRWMLDSCDLQTALMFEQDFWKSGVVGRPVICAGVRDQRSGIGGRGQGSGVGGACWSVPVRVGPCPSVPVRVGPCRSVPVRVGPCSSVSVHERFFKAELCRDIAALERGEIQSFSYDSAYFQETDHNRFRLFFRKEDKEFCDRMEHGAERLGDVMRFASGLIGKRGQEDIVSERREGPSWRKGIASGADVLPWRAEWRGLYLNFDCAALKSGFKDARYDAPKLLLRQTGDRLIAAYDPDGLLCLNNVHVGMAREGASVRAGDVCDPRLIAANLNSDLMHRYYQLISLEQSRAMAQTDIDVIESLPFKRPIRQDALLSGYIRDRMD
ncbi:MAG: Eco57I restriction-modification methylase domain-containing protein [Candidatus Sumerlaeota bacterium]|nr:Eco57I restriction-modification methylase domain-containing protein [Candidatus Sumerlaeota bacterium]